jgi:hypothetical protein
MGGSCFTLGKSRKAYRVLMGRPESKRPLGRSGYRGEVMIKMCNHPTLLGFSDVCLPNHVAAFHRLVTYLSNGTFWIRDCTGNRLGWPRTLPADIKITYEHTVDHLNEGKFTAVF